MFDFFDNQKNPLMLMMNMMNQADTEAEDAPQAENAESVPFELMTQAFAMQMQMMQTMQTMCMMPMLFMQSFFEALEASASDEPAPEGQKGGFKLGSFEIPPWLLAKLMQIDMSPENLAKLQRVLDFVFEAMPQPRDE